eukprot:m.218699 g.218699  ORF g.218699 m.218699 type:complete len:197 (+) comp54122_c2_seq3:698-1288(+)
MVLETVCEKRRLDKAHMAFRHHEDHHLFEASELEMTISSLGMNEIDLVDLAALIESEAKLHAHQFKLLTHHSQLPKSDVFVSVAFADGSRATLKVASNMSMGEFLFHVCERRQLNPVEYALYEDAAGKRSANLQGSISESNYKELYVLDNSKSKKKGVAATTVSAPGPFLCDFDGIPFSPSYFSGDFSPYLSRLCC